MVRNIGFLKQNRLLVDDTQSFNINNVFVLGNIELNVQAIDRHHDGACQDGSGERQTLFEEEFPEICEHGKTFGDNILGDERTFALLAFQVTLPDEFEDSGSDGCPAYVK